jgi:tetratricopeptide (TPR) repeat protein
MRAAASLVAWGLLAGTGGAASAQTSPPPTAPPPADTAFRDCVNFRIETARQLAGCNAVLDRGSGEPAERRARAHNGRGWAFYRMRRHEAALADYAEALRLAPNLWFIYSNRALLYVDRDEVGPATTDVEAALRLEPSQPTPLTTRGYLRYRERRLDEAMADVDKALFIDRTLARAFWVRGLIQRERGQDEAAVASFTEAHRLDPRRPSVLVSRAVTHERRGDLRLALADYEAALALNPDFRDAPAGRERVLRLIAGLKANAVEWGSLTPEPGLRRREPGSGGADEGESEASGDAGTVRPR